MRLPQALQVPDDDGAIAALTRYYGTSRNLGSFTGARFDAWDSTGTRWANTNRFTADDLVAVTFLSVNVTAPAAIKLLDTRAEVFSSLLTELGPDRDLAEEHEEWRDDWAGWTLWQELIELPGVGPTTASKLLARKRPRLRPIYDSVVANVLGSQRLWEPLRLQLTSEPALQERLLRLRRDAGLDEAVSALRVFDVIAWMEGKFGPP
ncbi:DUF6308 family protein [Aeromicrobium choanae]|uniref:Uncharacterized protein n=1 Tax=Aeromicrobium choanae TaxID=1736691 RepID=A0A1T4YS93_9ACTN|nr:DUF6308 family protein [Aeromicrobium choanae]SKB04141.1 hypothetical protein SAMN06295964_0483 [Aeromicrobium choanae]